VVINSPLCSPLYQSPCGCDVIDPPCSGPCFPWCQPDQVLSTSTTLTIGGIGYNEGFDCGDCGGCASLNGTYIDDTPAIACNPTAHVDNTLTSFLSCPAQCGSFNQFVTVTVSGGWTVVNMNDPYDANYPNPDGAIRCLIWPTLSVGWQAIIEDFQGGIFCQGGTTFGGWPPINPSAADPFAGQLQFARYAWDNFPQVTSSSCNNLSASFTFPSPGCGFYWTLADTHPFCNLPVLPGGLHGIDCGVNAAYCRCYDFPWSRACAYNTDDGDIVLCCDNPMDMCNLCNLTATLTISP